MSKHEQLPDTTGCDHDWQPMRDVPKNIKHFNFEQCTKCGNIRSDITPFPPLKLTEGELQYARLVAERLDLKKQVEALQEQLAAEKAQWAELRSYVEECAGDEKKWFSKQMINPRELLTRIDQLSTPTDIVRTVITPPAYDGPFPYLTVPEIEGEMSTVGGTRDIGSLDMKIATRRFSNVEIGDVIYLVHREGSRPDMEDEKP